MSSDRDPDVIIVGAGMAGAAISDVLVRSGARVLCLEQGPQIHAVDHPTFGDDWEFSVRRDWSFIPNVRKQVYDFPVVDNGTFFPYLFNAVGGSTNHYSAFWHRLKPVDFKKGTEHGVEDAIDWPITYEDLAPYYDQNDDDMGISGKPGDPAYPPRPNTERLPLPPHGEYFNLLSAGLNKLDIHWWPADNAILTTDRGERLACNGCGMCNLGCPRHSLGTATEGYLRSAVARGLDLRTLTRVTRVTTDKNGSANGVEFIDLTTGLEHHVGAPLVVVACNGIGTPRLLLMSKSKRHPNGLGNDNDQVGRYFMMHGYRLGDMWFDQPTGHWKGAFGAAQYTQEWYDTDLTRGCVNGITITFGGLWGPAYSALGGTTGLRPAPWGAGHRAGFEERFDRHVFCAIQADDLPVATNRVTLDPEACDPSGLPAARVHYDLHPNTRSLLEFGSDRLTDIADAAGAVGLDLQPMDDRYRQPGWHLMGTARMSSDPQTGVTDGWHRVWDTPGLVVCDGSSMTSGGAGNPTSTIGALALRCAEKLVAEMGQQVRAQEPAAR